MCHTVSHPRRVVPHPPLTTLISGRGFLSLDDNSVGGTKVFITVTFDHKRVARFLQNASDFKLNKPNGFIKALCGPQVYGRRCPPKTRTHSRYQSAPST